MDGIRKELNDLLAKQPNKIIVVIDDIDRLSNAEIRQIFQLIKSLGENNDIRPGQTPPQINPVKGI
ncbi:MAG: KAP family NTPase [Candidatus Brocadia sp.]|nr:KAP family NTPase [Candidatus Brocadia sp.]